MIDPLAKKFLGTGPITQVEGQTSKKAESVHAAYQMQEFLDRAGQFAEDMIAFFVEEKRRHQLRDDECAAAVALLAINLRKAYGDAQTPEEREVWTPAQSAARLAEFDEICEAMQTYFDNNYDKP